MWHEIVGDLVQRVGDGIGVRTRPISVSRSQLLWPVRRRSGSRTGQAGGRMDGHRYEQFIVSPSRLHALIDGVFAIAVTLLVLDLPGLDGGHDFIHRLAEHWPAYVAYLVSFASIGVIWIEHHGMMSAVQYINRRFLERTLVFLLFVSVIPWPTELAASHIRDGGSAARTVALLYAAVMMLMGLSMAASWRYLLRHEELVVPAAWPAMAGGAQRALLGALAYVPALILALLAPAASLGLDAVIAVYFAASRSEVPGLIHASALHGEDPTQSE